MEYFLFYLEPLIVVIVSIDLCQDWIKLEEVWFERDSKL